MENGIRTSRAIHLVSYLKEYIMELVKNRKLEYSPDFFSRLWAILKSEGEGLYPEVVELPEETEVIVKTTASLALWLIAQPLVPEDSNLRHRSIYHHLANRRESS
jgi:hypothetical protein